MNRSIRILIVACMAAAAHQAPVMAMQEMVKKDFDSHCAAALNPNQPVRERRIQIQRARQLLGTIRGCEQLFAAILDSIRTEDMNELIRLNAASDAELGNWECQIRDIIFHFHHDTNLNDRLNAAKTAQRMLADYRAIGHGVVCSSLENEINQFIFANSKTGSQDDFDVAGDSHEPHDVVTPVENISLVGEVVAPISDASSSAASHDDVVADSESRADTPVEVVSINTGLAAADATVVEPVSGGSMPMSGVAQENSEVVAAGSGAVETDTGDRVDGPETTMTQSVLNAIGREANNTLRGLNALLASIDPRSSATRADEEVGEIMPESGDQPGEGSVQITRAVSEANLNARQPSLMRRARSAADMQVRNVVAGAIDLADTVGLTQQAANTLAGIRCAIPFARSASAGLSVGQPLSVTGDAIVHSVPTVEENRVVASQGVVLVDVEAGRRPAQPEGTVAQETILRRVGRELINTWQGVQRVGSAINPFGRQTEATSVAESRPENSAPTASEEEQSVVAQSSAPEAGSARLEATSAVVPAATTQDESPRADTQVGAEGGYEGSRYETASQPPSDAVTVNMPASAQDDPESGMTAAAAGAPVESSNLFLRTFHLVGNWIGRARTVADNAMNWLAFNFGLGDLDNGKEE